MSQTESEIVTIRQTVHRAHTETVVRRWYDIVEVTIRRVTDPYGAVETDDREEEVVDWQVDLEEETLDSDVDDDEVVEEEVVYGEEA
jgi:hypothetical protein